MTKPPQKITLNEKSWIFKTGSLLPEVKFESGDAKEIALRESTWNIVVIVLWGGLMTFIGILIVKNYDTSGDPYIVLIPTIGIIIFGIGIYIIVNAIGKLIDTKKRDKLILFEEGLIDNSIFYKWETISDVRIKSTRLKYSNSYEIIILQKSGFVEKQEISTLKSYSPSEPEPFYTLRKVIDYYLNHKFA